MTAISCVGEMTIERWQSTWVHVGARVWCNGEDVTDRCRWFDQDKGLAELIEHDSNGRPFLDVDGGDIKTRIVDGEIQVMVP